jgi:hypothetical protein
MTEPAKRSSIGIGNVCWTRIESQRVTRNSSPGGVTVPFNTGMVARMSSIVNPKIIAPIYPKIAFVKSCVSAPPATHMTKRIARSYAVMVVRWKRAWAKTLAMDTPQSKTRTTSLRRSVRYGQLLRILWMLAASGGRAGSRMDL